MKEIVFITECQGTITERWVLAVPDDFEPATIPERWGELLDLSIPGVDVLSCDEQTDNEEDRHFKGFWHNDTWVDA